jgi:hypothetical protein
VVVVNGIRMGPDGKTPLLPVLFGPLLAALPANLCVLCFDNQRLRLGLSWVLTLFIYWQARDY